MNRLGNAGIELDPARRTWREWLVYAFAEDHCQWANRYVRWFATPLGVLCLAAIASLLCGLVVAPQGYVLCVAIVAVIALGFVWPWVMMRGLGCELRFESERAREGTATTVEVVVTNRWPWPAWGVAIEEGFFRELGSGGDAVVALARVNGWSRSVFRWSFVPTSRGVFPVSPPLLSTAFPFGLWRRRRAIDVAAPVVVWPATFWLPSLPPSHAVRSWAGELADRHAGDTGERSGVREYRPGDSIRSVHWPLTARMDRLMVSEREGLARLDAVVRVEVAPESHGRFGAESSLEPTLRIAASVSQAMIEWGATVRLELGRVGCDVPATRQGLATLLDFLATFDSDDDAAKRSPRLAAATRGRSTASFEVSITSSLARPATGRWIVVQTDDQPKRSPEAARQPWIAVTSQDDVAVQLVRAWRSVGKGAFHG